MFGIESGSESLLEFIETVGVAIVSHPQFQRCPATRPPQHDLFKAIGFCLKRRVLIRFLAEARQRMKTVEPEDAGKQANRKNDKRKS